MDINIPSQVKTFANLATFPTTGSVKTIYIAEDTDIAYYWTGSAYQAISIQDLSGLVPYTGATTDVDLGNNDLNAEGVKIKGTAGNGHLNMKHQYSNPTAGGQETVVFAGADGEPRFKNDGNAVEQFASREWVGLQGFQNTPIVVNSNITAQNDTVYHVVANATFTDPTPVEGRGYVVFVRNGTATIGGNPFSTAGNFIYRLFHSGAWALYPFGNINSLSTIFNAAYVPKTRTINGLDLSENRTLTTANINDSTNRRYVTDAEKTVIGNTSGTNTGDETQSSILSKLGWLRKIQKGGTITGTVSETLVHTFPFTANEYPASSILHVESQFIRTGTPVNNAVLRIRINTANTLVGSIQIGQTTMGGNPNLFSQFRRKFDIESGLVKGINSASNTITDLATSTLVPLSVSLDTTQDWWLFITCQPQNINDIAVVSFTEIKNF